MALYSTPVPEVPRLTGFNCFAWYCALCKDSFELLTLAKIEGELPPLPAQYTPPTYGIEFVVRGHTYGKVNDSIVELNPNDAFFILADHIHKEVSTSKDCEIYVMGFTTQFAEMLNMNLPQAELAQLLIQPKWHMTDQQLAIVLRYMDLLRILIDADKPSEVVHLVRSLLYFLAEEYQLFSPQQTATLTRSERICGEFLSLVEVHCRTQHTVEWYARQMCLAPKYLSNVVRQTLNTSPNGCIDQALIRQAKSLLSSTSLSIQEITDRLGFQNQSHFGTFFKRHAGVSPKEFRKNV